MTSGIHLAPADAHATVHDDWAVCSRCMHTPVVAVHGTWQGLSHCHDGRTVDVAKHGAQAVVERMK